MVNVEVDDCDLVDVVFGLGILCCDGCIVEEVEFYGLVFFGMVVGWV